MNATRFVVLAGVVLSLTCPEVRPQSLFWDTNPAVAGAQGGTGNWTGTNFWLNGANNQAWSDLAQATFGGTAGTVTVNSNVAVNGMAFTTSGYTISGTSTLTLSSPVIDVANPVSGSIAEISAPIGGSMGLVKNGQGILILSGGQANTFTGTTLVNDGTLFLSKTGATALNGDLVIGDNLGGANTVAVQQFASNQIPDTAKVTVNSDAVWTSFSQSETIASLDLNGGRVQFEPAGILSLSSVTTLANSATAILNGRVNLGGSVRAFNVANGTAATDLSMSPVQVGTDGLFNGGVSKLGFGTLALSGANTFDTLSINGGAISVADVTDSGVAGPLGAGSSVNFDGGTLMFTGVANDSMNRSIVLNPGGGTFNIPTFPPTLTLSGVISGAGALTKTGTGALRLTGTNTFTGPVNINASFIEVTTVTNSGVPGPLGAGTTINLNNGAFILSGFGTHSTNRAIILGTFGGTVSPGNGTLTLAGPISGPGGLSPTGPGVLVLSGNNTFGGNIFLSGNTQTLRIANGNAIPNTAEIGLVNGSTFDMNGTTETIGSLRTVGAGGGSVTLGSGTLTVGGDNTSKTFNGVISGTGGVVKIGIGTQTLTGASTFTSAFAINGGAISVPDVTDVGVAGPLGAGTNISFNGGTLIYTGAASDSTDRSITLNASGGGVRTTEAGAVLTLTGLISGSGTFTTSGVVELTGMNTFSGPLIVNGGILLVPSVANIDVTSPIGQGTSIVINNGSGLFVQGSGTHTTDRAIAINGGTTLSPGNGTVTYSGPITGDGGLDVTGPGVLVLSGTNTFAGTISVHNSTLRIANGSAIPDTAAVVLSQFNTPAAFDVNNSNETIGSLAGGSATTGAVTLGNGTLTIGANNNPASYDGVISGTGNIVKVGFGDFTLTRASTFTGSVTLQGGDVFVADVADNGVSSPLGAGASIIFGATGAQGRLVFTGASNDSTNRSITLNGSGGLITVSDAATVLTLDGSITGSGLLGISGPGTIVLSNVNTYTGATLLGQGTLRQASAGRFSSASAVSISNAPGAVLDLNNFNATIGSLAGGGAAGGNVLLGNAALTAGGDGTSTTFPGTMSGTGSFTKTGTGTMTLSGTNTYSGATNVNGGTLRFSGGNAIADTSPLNVAPNATAEFANGTETIASLVGDGSVALSGGNLSVGANNAGTNFDGLISGSGNLTKIGTGALRLSSAPTYTGSTSVNAGTLALNGGFDTAGAAINVAAGANLEARNSVSRAITGLGTVTATGTLIIGNSNSPSGFNFGGVLVVGTQQVILADSDLADLGNTTTLGPGGRLNSINGIRLAPGRSITAGANVGASISGNLTNNGIINGPAQAGVFLSLTGDVTGTGNYAGNIRFSDSFSPGNSPAAISLQNFILDSTHTLTLEIGGLVAGSQYDQLNFTGAGTVDGILTVTLISGFQPIEGHSFVILNGGTLTGTFDAVNLPQLTPGLAWLYLQAPNAATLVVIPEPSALGALLAASVCVTGMRRFRRRASA